MSVRLQQPYATFILYIYIFFFLPPFAAPVFPAPQKFTCAQIFRCRFFSVLWPAAGQCLLNIYIYINIFKAPNLCVCVCVCSVNLASQKCSEPAKVSPASLAASSDAPNQPVFPALCLHMCRLSGFCGWKAENSLKFISNSNNNSSKWVEGGGF